MFQQLQDQVQWRADLFLSGRFEDMSREYIFPLPVYVHNRLIALRTASEGMAQAASVRTALQHRQIETLKITVKAIEVPRDGRFRVWADWHAVSRDCRRSRRMGLVYYMRETGAGIRSEMLHYTFRRDSTGRALIRTQKQRA